MEDEFEEVSLIPDDEGGMEVVFSSVTEDVSAPTGFEEFNANLVEFLPEEELNKLTAYVVDRYDSDVTSTADFMANIANGVKLLGLKIEELDEPFAGACPITHPLILESAVKIQSKITGEVFSGRNIADVYIDASSDPSKLEKANRVKNYLDYQLLYQMKEYIPETDRLTLRYALTGNAFRKFYYDPLLGRIKSRYIPESNFIINADKITLEDADFYTEVSPLLARHEIEYRIKSGEYLNITEEDLNGGMNYTELSEVDDEISINTADPMGVQSGSYNGHSQFRIREHHCYFKFEEPFNDNEDRALPYIVEYEESTQKVVSIRRNWLETDPLRKKRLWYSHYRFVPGLGFYGYGYIHLLGNFQFALTQIARSLIDAGQFANMQGGFKKKGIRFSHDQDMVIGPGKFVDVEIGGQGASLADIIMPLDFKEPSQVLERLFMWLDNRAQKFADSTEAILADSTNYGPVGTTIALLEASTKFMSGVTKRFYEALKQELLILRDLNADILGGPEAFFMKGNVMRVSPEDFSEEIFILPSADPNMASSSQRLAMAQTKLQMAKEAPDIHDSRVAHRNFYQVMGLEEDEIDALLPPPEEAQPLDPMSDIIAASQGKPIKAFEGQDHDAHITFKEAFLQDPMGGASNYASSIVPIIQANIAEHALLRYMARMAAALQQVDPEQTGAEMAQAQAAEMLQKFNQMDANERSLAAGDPAVMVAQAAMLEAQAKLAEVKLKERTEPIKLCQESEKIDLKREELDRKDAAKAADIKANMKREQLKLGVDVVRDSLSPKRNK